MLDSVGDVHGLHEQADIRIYWKNSLMTEVYMATWKNEEEAREQIKALLQNIIAILKRITRNFRQETGSLRFPVFDEKEICSLTDAMLDFWLTTVVLPTGSNKEFAEWIGVKYAHLVNSVSSANLIAFMVLTAAGTRRAADKKG
jgi:CDP-6-deoxy-D-xylo-4-hexulose-3-dehydrase